MFTIEYTQSDIQDLECVIEKALTTLKEYRHSGVYVNFINRPSVYKQLACSRHYYGDDEQLFHLKRVGKEIRITKRSPLYLSSPKLEIIVNDILERKGHLAFDKTRT